MTIPHFPLHYITTPTSLRTHPTYSGASMVLSTIFLNLVPFVILTFLNQSIRGVIRHQQNSNPTCQVVLAGET